MKTCLWLAEFNDQKYYNYRIKHVSDHPQCIAKARPKGINYLIVSNISYICKCKSYPESECKYKCTNDVSNFRFINI